MWDVLPLRFEFGKRSMIIRYEPTPFVNLLDESGSTGTGMKFLKYETILSFLVYVGCGLE